MRRGLRRFVVDTSALQRSRDFRLLFLGQGISNICSQLRIVALPYQVFLLTHSSAMVGVLSLVQFIPLLLLSLLGGALADFRDRRRILFVTQSLLAAVSVLLAAGTYLGRASVGECVPARPAPSVAPVWRPSAPRSRPSTGRRAGPPSRAWCPAST